KIRYNDSSAQSSSICTTTRKGCPALSYGIFLAESREGSLATRRSCIRLPGRPDDSADNPGRASLAGPSGPAVKAASIRYLEGPAQADVGAGRTQLDLVAPRIDGIGGALLVVVPEVALGVEHERHATLLPRRERETLHAA